MKLNKIKLIGLTGGIATGKSTVSNILIKKGYKVIDADKIAREIVEKDRPAYLDIKKIFGEDIFLKNGEIDRKKLGEIVFNNPNKLYLLNSITHPRIYQEILNEIEKLVRTESLIFIDIPLLFEERDKIESSGIIFDEVWLVYADEVVQLDRLIQRDQITKDEAINKMNLQLDMKDKIQMSDKIINNNFNNKLKLELEVEKLLEGLHNRW